MNRKSRAWWKKAEQLVQDASDQEEKLTKLVEQTLAPDLAVSEPARRALQIAGPVAIPILLKGLTDTNARVRRNCVDMIDHGGYSHDTRCVEALLPMIHDPVARVRRSVWHTLFCEDCPDSSQCEIPWSDDLDLITLAREVGLNDPNLKVRQLIVKELAKQMPDPRVDPLLEKVMQEETDAETRAKAQQALGQ
ncbi:HEAT repeat domain-containing protein [Chloroflexi bacterium TSY]|nr:HEAT repeat domain-containing protein [Chloroflexi bacterium TSY]